MFDASASSGSLVAVEAEREPAVVLEPEVAVERGLQRRPPWRGSGRASAVVARLAGEVGAGQVARAYT